MARFSKPYQKPNLDHEALYRRAIADPVSITRAQRNLIFNWPPPEEEDRLCVAKTGHTRAELVAKAITDPIKLTHAEANIVGHHIGVEYDEWLEALSEEVSPLQPYENEDFHSFWARAVAREERSWKEFEEEKRRCKNPTPLEALLDEARDRVYKLPDDERTAFYNAAMRCSDMDQAEREAERLRERDIWREKRLKEGTRWMKQMLRNGPLGDGADCWGFVVFRTACYNGEEAEAAWRNFRDHFSTMAEVTVLG